MLIVDQSTLKVETFIILVTAVVDKYCQNDIPFTYQLVLELFLMLIAK